MKKLYLFMGLTVMLSMPSFAAVSANVAFSSDYVWRGMTQSDGPAIQGGFDFEDESGFYAGIWGSNVNFNDGAGSDFEEIYLGLSFGDLGLTLASGQDGAPDYTEVSYALGPVSFAYGEYDEYGDNITVSYSFLCGSYECGVAAYDFSDTGYGADEDGIYFSISASL